MFLIEMLVGFHLTSLLTFLCPWARTFGFIKVQSFTSIEALKCSICPSPNIKIIVTFTPPTVELYR